MLSRLTRESDVFCRNELRMNRNVFNVLCEMVRDIGGLRGNKNMSIEEIVAMFLYTLAHHKKNRSISYYFIRSGESVSRHFNHCLRAVLKLHGHLLANPTPISDDCEDDRWKCFKVFSLSIFMNDSIFMKYYVMAEMLCISGFGWDDEKKILQVERSVFDEWTKNHKKAKGLYGVPFPHFDILAEIYGKDRATGEASDSFILATQNIDVETTRESVTLDSDDDNFNAEMETESMHFGSGASGASGSRKRKDFQSLMTKGKKQRTLKRKSDAVSDLSSFLNSVSTEFGKIFQDMNAHLGAMAEVWGSEEERKKKLENESNKILEEVMKLDILSPSDFLEVATILMADEHKLFACSIKQLHH